MTDTERTETQNSLTSFTQKETQENTVMEQAQRLVNLYQHLSEFGEDFTPKYNALLLEASPEVQTMLSSLIGGPIVRAYYDYLKKQESTSTKETDTTEEYAFEEGYLPSPEEDILPIGTLADIPATGNGEGTVNVNALVQNMIRLQQAESERQEKFLQKALEQMQSVLLQQMKERQPVEQPTATCSPEQMALFSQSIESVMKSQTEILTKVLQQTNENSREIAANQTNRLMDFWKQQERPKPRYSDIIETVSEPHTTGVEAPRPPIIPGGSFDPDLKE